MSYKCSGDQDSVVPLLGSRTLVRELAHDLHFQTTVPYGAWFHKSQVHLILTYYHIYIYAAYRTFYIIYFHQFSCAGGRLGDRVWKSVNLCNCEGCFSYGTLCSAFKGFAFV